MKPYSLNYLRSQNKWKVSGPDGDVAILATREAVHLTQHLNRAYGLGAERIVKQHLVGPRNYRLKIGAEGTE